MKFFDKVMQLWKGNEFFRWASLVTVGATFAFIVAEQFWFSSAPIAALTAAVLVQGTFHESVKSGVQQLVGVFFGVIFGVGIFSVFNHLGALALFLSVTAGFLFAAVTKMTIVSAVNMVIPIIIVVGSQNITTFTVEQRLSGILIGGVVAVAASYTTRRGNPAERIFDEVSDISAQTSELLLHVSAALANPAFNQKEADALVTSSENNIVKLLEAKKDAEDAVQGAKFSPFLSKKDAVRVVDRATVALSIAIVVNTMTKTLSESLKSREDSSERTALAGSVADVVPENIDATAVLIAEQFAQPTESGHVPEPSIPDVNTVGEVKKSHASAVSAVKNLDETAPLLLSGSLLASSQHITSLLTKRAVDVASERQPSPKPHKE